MARRSRQPSKRKFSDKKFTIDSAGRLRIAGRFASKQQVGRWKGARTRRGLDVVPSVSTRVPSGKSPFSEAARKAAATRRLQSDGSQLQKIGYSDRFGFLRWEYIAVDFDVTTIQNLVVRVLLEKVASQNVVFWAEITAEDREGIETVVSTGLRDAKNPNASAELSNSVFELSQRYDLVDITEIRVIFGFSSNAGGQDATKAGKILFERKG